MDINPTTEQIVNLAREHIFILAYVLIGLGLMGMYRQWGFSGRYLFGLVFPLHWVLHWWIQTAWHDKEKFFGVPMTGLMVWAVTTIIATLCLVTFAEENGICQLKSWALGIGCVIGLLFAAIAIVVDE